MRRIGVFGGTFDPVHLGHLIAAQAALEALGLERVLFVPAGRPPHKDRRRLSPAADRLAMARLAVRGNPAFAVWDREARSPRPSYTVDSLKTLREEMKGARLHLLIGLDQAALLDTWRSPGRIFEMAEVDVLTRPGFEPDDLPAPWGRMVRLVEVPAIGISSSLVRRLARAGSSIEYLVPRPVARYIRERGLYRRPAPAGAGSR